MIPSTLCNTVTWNLYFSLVRSVLEYCWVTWATSIAAYLNDKIERVQKRPLRILFPEKHYSDALSCANVTRLDARREGLCLKGWHNIQAVPDPRRHHLLPPTRTISQPYNLRNTTKHPCLNVEQKGSKGVFSQQYRIDSVSVKYLNFSRNILRNRNYYNIAFHI